MSVEKNFSHQLKFLRKYFRKYISADLGSLTKSEKKITESYFLYTHKIMSALRGPNKTAIVVFRVLHNTFDIMQVPFPFFFALCAGFMS